MADQAPDQITEKKKKRSLRGFLGLPITGVLYNAPQFSAYDGDSSDVNEMIKVAKSLQETIDGGGKKYEVYDVMENDGIQRYTAQFQPDMKDKEVGSFPYNESKYVVTIKNPDDGKVVTIGQNPSNQTQQVVEKVKEKPEPKNLRHWSAKYWAKTPIKKILSEIIEPDSIDVSLLKFNDKLNPEIWEGDELKEEVRNALLKIAVEFIKSCKIEEYEYKDIVFVGSMANYTYTPASDIDLHVVMDFDQFKIKDEAILGEYFDAKKDLWSNIHDVKVEGHPVECFVQNSEEPYTSLGVYSLIKNEWVRKPIKKMISVDEGDIQLKAAAYMNTIDKLEQKFKKGEDVTLEAKKVKDKLKNMRKNSLHKEGEYSVENLVFKVLRNSGYLEKLIDLKNNSIDKTLSV